MKLSLKSIIIMMLGMFLMVGFVNWKTLRKVSKVENELSILKEILENKEKELDKKIIYYDKKLNLTKIRENMEKKGMKVADNIIFFEIEKNKNIE